MTNHHEPSTFDRLRTPARTCLGLFGFLALGAAGCDGEPEDRPPTGTPNKIFCQIHTATCRTPVTPGTGDSSCAEVWKVTEPGPTLGQPLFSFFYKWNGIDPSDQFAGVPQAAYAYFDDPTTGTSYRPAAGAITDQNRIDFGFGEYACDVPGKTPDEICAALCGTNRQGATEADGKTRAAAHPPLTDGGQPYCVGFPVVGPPASTMDAGMCHTSMKTQALTFMPGNPQSADLHAGMQGMGSGTNVRIGDAGANIPVIGGHVALKLPDAHCHTAPCRGRISSLELRYGNMIYTVGDREFFINDLTLDLADPMDVTIRPVAGTGRFRLDIPTGTLLYGAARRDGLEQTIAVRTPDQGNITYDPFSGDVTVDISWSSTVDGNTISGNVFATPFAIYNRPLDVNAGADFSVDAIDATCAAQADLVGSAFDPDARLLAQGWNLGAVNLSDGPTASTILPIGDHTLTFQALEPGAGVAFDEVTVHVLDKTLPEFVDPETMQSFHGCSPEQTAFHLAVPPARNLCSPALPTVTGVVTSVNGSATSIPVAADGSVALPAGLHTVVWTATNRNGPVTLQQEVRVVSEPTLYASRTLKIGGGADITAGTTLWGTVMNGAEEKHHRPHRGRHGGFGFGDFGTGSFTLIDDRADVGDVLSSPFLDLRSGVHVHGLVVHSDGFRRGRNVTIDGTIAELDDFPLPDVPWNAPAFDGGQRIFVRSGETETLAPGSFRSLTIKRGGRIILGNGVYALKEIDVEEGGVLVVPDAATGVSLYASRDLDYHGSAELSDGTAAPIFLGLAGYGDVTLDTSFWGIVVVPSGRLFLDDGVSHHRFHKHCFRHHGVGHGHVMEEPASYRGRFYAKDLEVAPKLDVDHDDMLCTPDP